MYTKIIIQDEFVYALFTLIYSIQATLYYHVSTPKNAILLHSKKRMVKINFMGRFNLQNKSYFNSSIGEIYLDKLKLPFLYF